MRGRVAVAGGNRAVFNEIEGAGAVLVELFAARPL
jgi:hypothetical protein